MHILCHQFPVGSWVALKVMQAAALDKEIHCRLWAKKYYINVIPNWCNPVLRHMGVKFNTPWWGGVVMCLGQQENYLRRKQNISVIPCCLFHYLDRHNAMKYWQKEWRWHLGTWTTSYATLITCVLTASWLELYGGHVFQHSINVRGEPQLAPHICS